MGLQTTNITWLGLTLLAVIVIAVFLSPRRWLPLPVIAAGCWLPLGLRLVFYDLNFHSIRIVVVAVLVRMLIRNEFRLLKPERIDRVFLFWQGLKIATFTLLWMSGDAFVNRVGLAIDAVGMYFCFRLCVRDLADVIRIARLLAVVLLPVALAMIAERFNGTNVFSMLGGLQELSMVRDGVVRSQGPFSHPILAGTVGALWVPVFLGLWKSGSGRVLAVVGVLSGVAMTLTSGSSGPLMTLLVSLGALCVWPLRHRMRFVRRAIVVALIVLQLSMSQPIWFIFARINVLSASTGWHRSHLIDLSVRHFFEWFILGVKDVGAWGVFASDITNQYLLEGLRGGMVTMSVFILILVRLFGAVGSAVRSEWVLDKGVRVFVWSMGAMLIAHTATFFSVAYFESQSLMQWYLSIALVVALSDSVERQRVTTVDGLESPDVVELAAPAAIPHAVGGIR
jgi:hypothetical protein